VDVLPWERLLWSRRAWWSRDRGDFVTDFRVVHADGPRSWEIAIADIRDVDPIRTRRDRVLGRSTLILRSRDPRRPPVALAGVSNGPELAALIELAASDPQHSVNGTAALAAIAWRPRSRALARALVPALVLLAVLALAVTVGLDGRAAVRTTYGPDDPIAPNGEKRPREDIVLFMEQEVMPWARTVLGPITGGRVTCATCHSDAAEGREWRMPAVAKLPEPHIRLLGSDALRTKLDPQAHNALFGYLAEADNQTKAAYMREVVLPGMARLLRRPAYDFTRPYWHNRERLAFGCYHCHKV
jgi:hypothetical protein